MILVALRHPTPTRRCRLWRMYLLNMAAQVNVQTSVIQYPLPARLRNITRGIYVPITSQEDTAKTSVGQSSNSDSQRNKSRSFHKFSLLSYRTCRALLDRKCASCGSYKGRRGGLRDASLYSGTGLIAGSEL
jgi:hypothetical protein